MYDGLAAVSDQNRSKPVVVVPVTSDCPKLCLGSESAGYVLYFGPLVFQWSLHFVQMTGHFASGPGQSASHHGVMSVYY